MIAVNVLGLIGALVIAVGLGFLWAVIFHGKVIPMIATILVSTAAVFALPIWSMTLACSTGGAGVAVWLVPIIYGVLGIPIAIFAFGAAGAAARP